MDCASIDLSYLAPASTPYLSTYLEVLANTSATEKILKKISPESWPTGKAAQKTLVDRFNNDPLQITFDMDTVGGYTSRKMIPLEPGYVYTLTADVQITPIYRESTDFFNNMMGYYTFSITGWKKSVISTSITRTDASYFTRQRTTIRYVINFRDDIAQISLKLVFGVVQFMVALGAAAGYLGFGTLILDNWQKMFPHPDNSHDSGYHETGAFFFLMRGGVRGREGMRRDEMRRDRIQREGPGSKTQQQTNDSTPPPPPPRHALRKQDEQKAIKHARRRRRRRKGGRDAQHGQEPRHEHRRRARCMMGGVGGGAEGFHFNYSCIRTLYASHALSPCCTFVALLATSILAFPAIRFPMMTAFLTPAPRVTCFLS